MSNGVRINRQATVHAADAETGRPACSSARVNGRIILTATTDAVTCRHCALAASVATPVAAPVTGTCGECGSRIPASNHGVCLMCD